MTNNTPEERERLNEGRYVTLTFDFRESKLLTKFYALGMAVACGDAPAIRALLGAARFERARQGADKCNDLSAKLQRVSEAAFPTANRLVIDHTSERPGE